MRRCINHKTCEVSIEACRKVFRYNEMPFNCFKLEPDKLKYGNTNSKQNMFYKEPPKRIGLEEHELKRIL